MEVYHRGQWGTVCDDGWDITDAHVVCQQLGYSGATSAHGQAIFGQGSGPIHYDEVACNGSETRLANCSHSGIGVGNCAHNEDAGVVCNNNTLGELIYYNLYFFKSTVDSIVEFKLSSTAKRSYKNYNIAITRLNMTYIHITPSNA